jgi:multiple sugar transport system permease protein
MLGENMELSGILSKIVSSTKKKRKAMSDSTYSKLLVAPAMLVLVFFGLFPLFYAINLSFRHVDLTSSAGSVWNFVGLNNFRYALADNVFWQSSGKTLFFAVVSVSIQMVLGIFLAFQINKLKWFKGITRALFLLPLASAPAAVGMIWRYLYDSEFGVFNAALAAVGLQPLNWLGDSKIALFSIILFDVWQWTPYVLLITLAGLQSLPKEPFEAAELDGASTFMVLRRLTFPLLSPVLTLIFILRSIDAARLYDPIATTTRGGPGTATETVTYLLYRVGLKQFRLDIASAEALIIMFVIVVFAGLVLKRLMRQQGERARTK